MKQLKLYTASVQFKDKPDEVRDYLIASPTEDFYYDLVPSFLDEQIFFYVGVNEVPTTDMSGEDFVILEVSKNAMIVDLAIKGGVN
jgi:hypothetical protein